MAAEKERVTNFALLAMRDGNIAAFKKVFPERARTKNNKQLSAAAQKMAESVRCKEVQTEMVAICVSRLAPTMDTQQVIAQGIADLWRHILTTPPGQTIKNAIGKTPEEWNPTESELWTVRDMRVDENGKFNRVICERPLATANGVAVALAAKQQADYLAALAQRDAKEGQATSTVTLTPTPMPSGGKTPTPPPTHNLRRRGALSKARSEGK